MYGTKTERKSGRNRLLLASLLAAGTVFVFLFHCNGCWERLHIVLQDRD